MLGRNDSFYHHCCCLEVSWCSKNSILSKSKWGGAQAVVREDTAPLLPPPPPVATALSCSKLKHGRSYFNVAESFSKSCRKPFTRHEITSQQRFCNCCTIFLLGHSYTKKVASTLLQAFNTAAFEEMSQQWRAVGSTEYDLTDSRFEPQISRSRDEWVTARPIGRYNKISRSKIHAKQNLQNSCQAEFTCRIL